MLLQKQMSPAKIEAAKPCEMVVKRYATDKSCVQWQGNMLGPSSYVLCLCVELTVGDARKYSKLRARGWGWASGGPIRFEDCIH
jgi:hypothetical protein